MASYPDEYKAGVVQLIADHDGEVAEAHRVVEPFEGRKPSTRTMRAWAKNTATKTRSAPGSKTIRTEATSRRLIRAASVGNTNRTAALAAGISERAFYSWLSEDAEFADAYACARAQGQEELVGQIRLASMADWKAAAWLLERMDPEHWSKQEVSPESLARKMDAYLQGVSDGAGAVQRADT